MDATIESIYRKKHGRQDFLNKETLNKLKELTAEIKNFNFVREYFEIKDCISIDVAAPFFESENISSAELSNVYVSILSDQTGQHIALELRYVYADENQQDNMIGLVLSAQNCYKVKYAGEQNQKADILFDEELTNTWHDILTILYEHYNKDLTN